MMATVRHVTSEAGRTKIQGDGFLLNRVYKQFEINFETTSYLLKEQFLGKTTFLET